MFVVIEISENLPLSLDEAKDQLVIDRDFTDDDDFLKFLIKSQTILVENYLMQHIREKTIRAQISASGTERVRLPWPVKSLVKIHAQEDNESMEVDEATFRIDKFDKPHRIFPRNGIEWLSGKRMYYIDIIVGMDIVPEDIKDAILILVTDKYENRTEQVRGKRTNVYEMLAHHRYKEFANVYTEQEPVHWVPEEI